MISMYNLLIFLIRQIFYFFVLACIKYISGKDRSSEKDMLVAKLPTDNVGTPIRNAPVVHPLPIFAPTPKESLR